MHSPSRRKRIARTPMRSAMKGTNRKKLGLTSSRLTFVSTPMVREYFDDAPVSYTADLNQNLKVSPSAMGSTELERELEVRDEINENTKGMTPNQKAVKVETLWREEIENELRGYDFPVSTKHTPPSPRRHATHHIHLCIQLLFVFTA